jgi:putative intracellular protease/amidase
VDAASYQGLVLPGGRAPEYLRNRPGAVAIVRHFVESGKPIAANCHGPLLVIAAGGAGATRSAGIVFAATMLVRAPVYVFQGLAAALLPNLTHLNATDDHAPFRRAVLRTAVFLLGCGALVVVGLAVAGSQAMGILYGNGFHASRVDLMVLGAGIGLYLAASTVSQALLALDTGRRTAAGWAASAAIFVVLFAVLPGGDLARVSGAFTGATLALLATLAIQLDRRTRR